MIEEDYVSFETAKLLKEKGFDSECHSYYYPYRSLDGSIQYGRDKSVQSRAKIWYKVSSLKNLPKDHYLAPTLQMAMKWLRKEYKIGVFPSTYAFMVGENGSAKHVYGTAIINLETYELMTNDIMPMPTYEEAIDTAIKYCLENLI